MRYTYTGHEDKALPIAELKVFLSDKRHKYERTRYSVMNLLSDYGGFQGAIVMIPSPLMSLYASGMLRRSLANQTPTVKKHKD